MFSQDASRALEVGRWDGPVSRALASVWGRVAARRLVRAATVPPGVAVVCVGGATLGGSGKTRLAIASARALDDAGARVVLVGHGYRARGRAASVVDPSDAVESVGDEALVCARALGLRVPVVVGPTRASALECAARLRPDVLVLDGPLRVAIDPARCLSLLAVDADEPWGSGRPPPAGDLRADRDALIACADHVVPVDAAPTGARFADREATLVSLRGMRLGLFMAIARPHRLIRKLDEAGVRPEEIVQVPDHGPMTEAARAVLLTPRARRLDAWIATEKCALHLSSLPPFASFGVLGPSSSWTQAFAMPLKSSGMGPLTAGTSGAASVRRTYMPRLDRFCLSAIVSSCRRVSFLDLALS